MKNNNFNYRIDLPMSSKERNSRRIKAEISRILVESKFVSQNVGYLEIPEEIITKAFDILSNGHGVVAQPLGLHMSYKEFVIDAKEISFMEIIPLTKSNGFFVKCATSGSFLDFFRLIKCETVAIFSSNEKFTCGTLFAELYSAVETNQYDLIILKHLKNDEAYGFISLNHPNLEIIGYIDRIKEIYEKLLGIR
ncbi:MAG: hypothetical protein H6754_02135 [Candidatus Omnitrophica bacterium]|nr:hypothetical protein [Candidatus Omnitrophota bacterium]